MTDQESVTREQGSVTQLTKRKGLKKGVYLLPNLITTGALFSGFYAIVAATTGAFETACIAIVIAGFLDALDGRIARLTNTTSQFGVQYDSMADLVAFGVAPAILLFSWALEDLGKIGWIIAFLYMCCAALRLARFNIAPDTKVFYGLASPGAAGTMSTLVWIWVDNFPPMESMEVSVLVGLFTTFVALLMVSNVQYFSPKNIKGRVPYPIMLGAVLLFIVVAIYPPGMLFCVGLAYAVSGPIQALLRLVRGKDNLPEV
ncbi:MAG: CDP-diacylglycerol--serine O-phosphatidyltransferase [Pseudomonadales bacterium]|nr:CDP-diacylglycerol--serine O-phosphatidyltransferase [Pseudomonadales bacterium]